MPDIDWDRLEPHTRDVDLEEGLSARIADPLFLLARQWQVGEFRGEDAASPIRVRMDVESAPLTTFRNEREPGMPPEPLDRDAPLEARVEAEVPEDSPGRFRLAADAGLALLRRVDLHEVPTFAAALRATYGLSAPEVVAGSAQERRRLRMLARGAIDGIRAYDDGTDALVGLADASEHATVRPLVLRWRAEQASRIARPAASGPTWTPERLTHRFSVAATSEDGEVVLRARDYPGGHLDWYSFDVDCGAAHGGEESRRRARRRRVGAHPVPLAYAGMPASRYWEREDGTVHFGGLEAGPTDIGRLVVAEYATIYGDDWFLVPLRVPVGGLVRVRALRVADVFGGVHTVEASAALDHEALDGARPFAFFELSGDPSAAHGETPWLFLPPTPGTTQSGVPREVVGFVRDEVANLVWGIEERIETPSGGSRARRLDAPPPSARAPDEEGTWAYRLQRPVPPHWVPFVSERPDPQSAEMVLRRARLLAWDELPDPQVAGARGALLQPDAPLALEEHAIPRGGLRVERHWQIARGPDGRLHAWLARRSRPGTAERGSGLRYDGLER